MVALAMIYRASSNGVTEEMKSLKYFAKVLAAIMLGVVSQVLSRTKTPHKFPRSSIVIAAYDRASYLFVNGIVCFVYVVRFCLWAH